MDVELSPAADPTTTNPQPIASSSQLKTDSSTFNSDLDGLIDELVDESICAPAWSNHNLLAQPSRSSTSHSPSIDLSYFTAIPPSSNPTHGGRVSHSLTIPSLSSSSHDSPARLTRLTFSPDGGQLLAVTRVGPTSAPNVGDDWLSVFAQTDGAVDSWECVWHERARRFGVAEASGGKRVVGLRWLGEERRWYPTPSELDDAVDSDGIPKRKRPLYAAPMRSPPVPGTALLVVLSTSELLFAYLPQTTPFLPLTVTAPLSSFSPKLSLTAIASAPSPIPVARPNQHQVLPLLPSGMTPASMTSPQNAMDDLVATLVVGMPEQGPSPGVVAGVLGLKQEDAGAGTGALEEELRKAEIGQEPSPTVQRAALGFARNTSPATMGESLVLLAYTTLPKPEPIPILPPQEVNALDILPSLAALPSHLTAAANSPGAASDSIGLGSDFDFNALDDAFGDDPIKAVSTDAMDEDRKKGDGGEDGPKRKVPTNDGERKISLVEVKVEMMAQDGPRLTVRPLAPVHLTDALHSSTSAAGRVTHLEWIEDVQVGSQSKPSAEGTEQQLDLRLLVVTATAGEEPKSTLTTWALSNTPYQLSDAFALLENKKGDATQGETTWATRRAASRAVNGLVCSVLPRAGTELGTFAVAEVAGQETWLYALNSNSLEQVAHLGATKLDGGVYQSIVPSTGRALVCASLRGEPGSTIAPFPLAASTETLPTTLATHLAIALVAQRDTADVVGRVLSLPEAESSTKFAVRCVRDTLSSMLPQSKPLEGTSLQLDLLALTATLYSAFPALEQRGELARDMLDLAACCRAFARAQQRERGAVLTDGAYRCESDSIWPLIAHATWYAGFAHKLARECSMLSTAPPVQPAEGGGGQSPRQLLLLSPFSRALLLQAATFTLGLQGFLHAFPPQSNLTIDMARVVLDDAVEEGGMVLKEWRSTLVGVGEVEGLNSASPELASLLVRFEIPPALSTPRAIVSALLSTPALFANAAPPTPPATPPFSGERADKSASSANAVDVVSRARLREETESKRCTRCGSRTELKRRGREEGGRWASWELGWESRCCCGGAWVRQAVQNA